MPTSQRTVVLSLVRVLPPPSSIFDGGQKLVSEERCVAGKRDAHRRHPTQGGNGASLLAPVLHASQLQREFMSA
jgi:hypothetical protein